MEEEIIKVIQSHECNYVAITNDESLLKVFNLLTRGIMFEPESGIECLYVGWYYHVLVKDFDKAKYHYIQGSEKGDHYSMNELAWYYKNVTKDYNKMEEWYSKGHESGNSHSMIKLGHHYREIKDYDKMKACYLKAHESGNPNGMLFLASHYREIKDYDKMIECYLLADNARSMNNMGTYYYAIVQDYEMAKHWFLMCVEKGDVKMVWSYIIWVSIIRTLVRISLKWKYFS